MLTLKLLSSSEVDLETWKPRSREEVFICLDMEIGLAGGRDGTNMFYVTLATPESLRMRRDGVFLVTNRTLVVSDYNLDAVIEGIKAILAQCDRDNWSECCRCLQRYFHWEYEDYEAE